MFDSFGAVELEVEVFTFGLASLFSALEEGLGDFLGIFVAGIVFGDDDDVAIFTEDFAADDAGGFVTTAGATVDGDNATGVIFDRFKNLL